VKVCKKCGINKELKEFYKHKLTLDGYRGECKICVKLHNKNYHIQNKIQSNRRNIKYYYNNKEDSIARVKKYRQEKPASSRNYDMRRRALMRNSKTFTVTNKEIEKLYSMPCIYCGSKENITIDHIIPITRGGMHVIGNLAPACSHCNSSKNNRTITDWRISKIRQFGAVTKG
jgi:5-methylcytosine-specific restriction endonuclease McrA